MNILNKSALTYLWNLIGAVVIFMLQFILASNLGANLYGEANYYLGISSTIAIFSYFGMQMFFPKYLQLEKNKISFFSKTFYTISLYYLILIPIYYIILMFFNINKNIIFIFMISYGMIIVEMLFSFYVGKKEAYKGVFIRRTYIGVSLGILFLTFYVFFDIDVYLYLIIYLIVYLLLFIVEILPKLTRPKFHNNFIKKIYKFHIIQIMYGVFLSVSKVIQGEIGNYKLVAILSISISIGSAVNLFGESFSRVVMPNFAIYFKNREFKNIRNEYQYVTRINSFLIIPLVIMLCFSSNQILLVLGDEYQGGLLILIFVILSQAINSLVGPNGTLLNMAGQEKREIKNGTIKFFTAIAFSLVLGKSFYWGVALAILISELMVNIIKTVQVKRIFNLVPFTKKDLQYIITITLLICIFFSIISMISNFYLLFFINALSIFVVYILIFKYSPNKEDKIILKKIKDKFRSS